MHSSAPSCEHVPSAGAPVATRLTREVARSPSRHRSDRRWGLRIKNLRQLAAGVGELRAFAGGMPVLERTAALRGGAQLGPNARLELAEQENSTLLQRRSLAGLNSRMPGKQKFGVLVFRTRGRLTHQTNRLKATKQNQTQKPKNKKRFLKTAK